MMGERRYLHDLEKLLPKEKPPLGEIAEMPFPLSMCAMRRFYNKNWHKPEHDGESLGKWRVEISYSHREEETFSTEIEAACEDDAKAKATEQFDKTTHWQSEVEIDEIEVEFVEAVEERAAA